MVQVLVNYSIVPLRKLKNKKIKQILIISNTLSSSKIIKFKIKKVVHQFFPIDANFNDKFIKYWKLQKLYS